jgi:hypothetical protein
LVLALSGTDADKTRSLRLLILHSQSDERETNSHGDRCYYTDEQQLSQIVESTTGLLNVEKE